MNDITPDSLDDFLTRIFEGQASEAELTKLQEWLKTPENMKYFRQFRDLWNATAGVFLQPEEVEKAANEYRNYMDTHPVRLVSRHRMAYLSIAAAVALLLISVSAYFLYLYSRAPVSFANETLAAFEQDSSVARRGILLKHADGSVENLSESFSDTRTSGDGVVIKQNNERELEYIKGDSCTGQVFYNEISIPAGERFNLVLSDGTRVWLNSETTLRYPVNFVGKTREVVLSGQAYFDVAKDKRHPFIVVTDKMKIEALGTAFDVSAYKEEAEATEMILVEGSVKVTSGQHEVTASPNQQVLLNPISGQLSVLAVDARNMTLWKDGILVLKQLPFSRMLHKLEQWYGIEIINLTRIPEDELFNGKFDRENVRDAMETISISTDISYSISGHQITLNTRRAN